MAVAPTDDRTRRTTFQKSVAILKLKKEHIDERFAYHGLTAGLRHFINLSAGAAQKNLLLRDLRSYSFQVPVTLAAQRLIAKQCDELAELTRQLGEMYERKLAALDELKKSLLHQAFSGAL
jgi:type I restriction enzyme S subunit